MLERLSPGRAQVDLQPAWVRWLRATLIALILVYIVVGCGAGDNDGLPRVVTAPYSATVRLQGDFWQVTESIDVDAPVMGKLAPYLDVDLANELGQDLQGDAWTYLYVERRWDERLRNPDTTEADSILREVIVRLSRANNNRTVMSAADLLGIAVDDARCIAAGCPSVIEILNEAYTNSLDHLLGEQDWRATTVVDGVRSYYRSRELPARVPRLSWETNRLSIPRVPVVHAIEISPSVQSRISIIAPKGMVASTYPSESGRSDTLDGNEEEVEVEIGDFHLSEIRVDVLGPMLHSPQGHALYRLIRWPTIQLAVGAAVIFALAALRDKIKAAVSRWLRPLSPQAEPTPDTRNARRVSHRRGLLQDLREKWDTFIVGCLWLAALWGVLSSLALDTDFFNSVLWALAGPFGPFSGPMQLILASLMAMAVGYLTKIDPQLSRQLRDHPPKWVILVLRKLRLGRVLGWVHNPALSPKMANELVAVRASGPNQPRELLQMQRDLLREVPELAARLQSRQQDSNQFEDYRRLLAEASLRRSIASPLAVLLAMLTWQLAEGLWSAVLLAAGSVVCIWFLLIQARQRVVRSNGVVVRAAMAGILESRVLTPVRDKGNPASAEEEQILLIHRAQRTPEPGFTD